MDIDELLNVWNGYNSRQTWRDIVIARGGNVEAAEEAMTKLPDVTALDALRANREIVELLASRRWYVMRDAREAGASWSQIGEALGMSKQGAQDYYRRRIAAKPCS